MILYKGKVKDFKIFLDMLESSSNNEYSSLFDTDIREHFKSVHNHIEDMKSYNLDWRYSLWKQLRVKLI